MGEKQEAEWRDPYTEEVLGEYTKPWYPGHDEKFGDLDDCTVYYTDTPDEYAWGESMCDNFRGCSCQYSRQPALRLRGACLYNQFDTLYTLYSEWESR